jgi:hypothetical protein
MRKISGFALASVALMGLSACSDPSPPVSADGFLTLFDGGELTYFSTLGDANWRIEDSAVVADESTAPSWLVSNEDYTNFELELEFWVDSTANSGIFLRCQDREAVSDTSCYEVNIYDTRPDQTYRTGGIVNVVAPDEFVYTGGQWNRYEIMADGNHLQVTLNGRDLVDVEDSQFSSGPVALQYGSGIVKFRNVRIRRL